MEAIVLALTPQTATATVNQTDQATSESSSPFAPHLTKAISAKNESPVDKTASTDSSTDIDNSTASALSALNMQSEPANDNTEQVDMFLDAEPGSISEFSAAAFLFGTGQANGGVSPDIKELLAVKVEQAKANPLFYQAMAALITGTSADNAGASLAAVLPETPDLLQGHMVTGQSLQPIQPGGVSQKQELTLLLSQLQDLINSNETKGIVVQQQPQTDITLDELTNLTTQVARTVPTAQVATRTVPTAQVATQTVAASPGSVDTISTPEAGGIPASQNIVHPDMAIEPASTKTPSLRQEIQQQYLDGKINLNEDKSKNGGNGQRNQQESTSNGQNSNPVNNLSLTQGDPKGESALFSLPTHDTGVSQQVSQHGKLITLPSGTMVTEQEILNQIMQRFHLTNRNASSRINLKLHPAELGELKINLTIKEGSIKANVMAQSQHVQEILERNMPKLRASLQQQGFVIDDIVVTSKSETVGNFDLSGGQLPNRQGSASSGNEQFRATTFEATLDSSIFQTTIPESGLNIRA